MVRQSSREIDVEAAQWAARADRGPLPARDQQALDDWLAADVRRVGAYAKARGVALFSQRAQALGPGFDPDAFAAAEQRPQAAPVRRRWLLTGGLALAASLAGIVAVRLLWPGAGDVYETRRGEVRVVSLADGSVVTLNTDSRIAVDYQPGRRLIRLARGEALFDVAKDKTRPFFVDAGDARVRAVGTSFTVSRLTDSPVQVLVREGVVEVDARRDAAPVRLHANMRAVARRDGDAPIVAQPVPVAEVGRELVWREGRLAFQGETLQQAADRFARYSDIRIVIDDPAAAAEPISGLYQANDPVGFSRAVASSLGLRAEVGAGEVRLRR